jgi:Phage integrase family
MVVPEPCDAASPWSQGIPRTPNKCSPPVDPDAPLLPSERRDPHTGRCGRAGDDALRSGLAAAVARWLPAWQSRLGPHVLRHYCASSLYARGMDLKAIQDTLGHVWLSTTTRYINPRELHQPGEIREVCPGTKGRNELPTAPHRSFVTWDYARMSPSDARFARHPGKIIRTAGPPRARSACPGPVRAHGANLRVWRPGGLQEHQREDGSGAAGADQLRAFRRLEYPSAPVGSAKTAAARRSTR